MLHKGSCHCKAIEFEIESDLDKIMQCNCSICIRKNAKMIMVAKNNFKLTKGDADLSTYQFNLNLAEHFFVNTVESIHIISDEQILTAWVLI